jgi:hypothetical protein
MTNAMGWTGRIPFRLEFFCFVRIQDRDLAAVTACQFCTSRRSASCRSIPAQLSVKTGEFSRHTAPPADIFSAQNGTIEPNSIFREIHKD